MHLTHGSSKEKKRQLVTQSHGRYGENTESARFLHVDFGIYCQKRGHGPLRRKLYMIQGTTRI